MNANEQMISAALAALPPQEVSVDVLLEKYAKGAERGIEDVQARVAHALAELEAPGIREAMRDDFLWAQQNGFVPAGRIASAAGTGMKATLMNCFVQPVGDSVTG